MESYNKINRDSFKKIYNKSKTFDLSFGVFKYVLNDKKSKIVVVVSSKVVPKAVLRNKTKRRIKAVFNILSKKFDKPLVVLFFVKKSIINESFENILKEFEDKLSKHNLIK